MPWYVFAFVDRPPAKRQGRGLAGALAVRRVPGGFAAVERRADVPPVEFDVLKRHDAVVTRLAAAVPAILPVRFGTLMELDEIEAALEDREEELDEAFDLVRGRVQFTWRSEVRRARHEVSGPIGEAARTTASLPGAGAAYLRRIARASKPSPPAAFRGAREKLRPLVAAERYERATTTLPDSLYHLVERANVERYRLLAGKLGEGTLATRVSGPFAPFAFTPDLL
jgi:Gas vesicle synthesis protein GvpL/GvpF